MSAVVYTLWGADKRALYVGCTTDLPRRMREHEAGRPQMVAETVWVSWSQHADWNAGRKVEAPRIAKLRPPYNTYNTSGHRDAHALNAHALTPPTVRDRKRESLRQLRLVHEMDGQTGARLFDADVIDQLASQYKRSNAPTEPAA